MCVKIKFNSDVVVLQSLPGLHNIFHRLKKTSLFASDPCKNHILICSLMKMKIILQKLLLSLIERPCEILASCPRVVSVHKAASHWRNSGSWLPKGTYLLRITISAQTVTSNAYLCSTLDTDGAFCPYSAIISSVFLSVSWKLTDTAV